MPKIEIPEYVKDWYRSQGVSKLPQFLDPNFVFPMYQLPFWAYCKQRRFVIPSTPGNVEYEIIPDSGKRLKLISVVVKVTTDATVANRELKIAHEDEDDNKIGPKFGVGAAITASSTAWIQVVEMMEDLKTMGWESLFVMAAGEYILNGTDKMVITLQSGVAGDAFEGYATFWEVDTV